MFLWVWGSQIGAAYSSLGRTSVLQAVSLILRLGVSLDKSKSTVGPSRYIVYVGIPG